MRQRTLRLLAVISVLCLMALQLQAQVTVGASEEPVRGALLDLKCHIPDPSNVTSETGGLVLPRVKLENLNTLEPFIKTNDTDWVNNATTKIKENHTGLIVYNLTNTPTDSDVNKRFTPGMYQWNGTKWVIVTISAENGLTMDISTVKLGGNLSQATTTITGDAQSLVFNLQNVAADDKGLFFKSLPTHTVNKYPLAVDVNTGKVGLLGGESEAKIAFLQSNTYQYLDQFSTGRGTTGDTANEDRTRIIPWTVPNGSTGVPSTGGDMTTNNLVEFDLNENAFILLEDAAVELSGYIGYAANVTNATPTGSGDANPTSNSPSTHRDQVTIVNASIQVKEVSKGETLYKNWSSVRAVYPYFTTYYRQTLSIPPAMFVGKKGDKIRMVVIPKPSGLGDDHTRPAVVTPFGSDFCKSLKIIAQ